MLRCLVAPMLSVLSSRIDAGLEAFWSSKVASKFEMALASNRQWNGSINRFWNAFGSHFAPHLGPIGLHLGFAWASLGPILATPGPHWAPFAPNFDPIGPMSASRTPHSGPFELHLCPRGPFELHLSSISDPCWLHLDQICIPFDTDRQTRSHTDRPTSNSGSGLAECAQRLNEFRSGGGRYVAPRRAWRDIAATTASKFILTCIFEGMLLQNGAQMEQK